MAFFAFDARTHFVVLLQVRVFVVIVKFRGRQICVPAVR